MMVDYNAHLMKMERQVFQLIEDYASQMGWSIETTIAVWTNYFSEFDLEDFLRENGKLPQHCSKRKE